MAKTAPYFPFYVDDWLDSDDVFEMSLEERGAYITLLAAMWKRGGSVKDDQRLVCHILGCRPAKWKKIRAKLEGDLGVIFSENGQLFNKRLSKEFQKLCKKSQKSRESANKRWQESDENDTEKPNKINTSTDANALRTQYHTDTDTDTDTDIKEPKGSSDKASLSLVHPSADSAPPPDAQPPSQKLKFDYQAIAQQWSKVGLSEIRVFSDARKRALRARYRELIEAKPELADVPPSEALGRFFEYAGRSRFLTGENDRGWVMDFDWLLKPANFVKVLEGKYHREEDVA